MTESDESIEEQMIQKVLHAAFGWALTKDRNLFVSTFSNDDDLFCYFPDSRSTVRGWKQFEKFLEIWMEPRNIAKGFEIRDLRIVMSHGRDVAWFSAVADDEGEFDGVPWGSKDIRWTGVLEKRKGNWRIRQQHMSQANDIRV